MGLLSNTTEMVEYSVGLFVQVMAVDFMSGRRDVTLRKSPTLILRKVDVKGISLPLDLVRLTTNCQVTVKPLDHQDDTNLQTGSVQRPRCKPAAEVSSAAPAQSRVSRRRRKCPKRLISGPVASPLVKVPSDDAPTVRNPLPSSPRAKQGDRKWTHVAINGCKSDRLSNKPPPLLVSPTVLVRDDSSGPAAVSTMKGKRSEKSAKPKPRGCRVSNNDPGGGRNQPMKNKKQRSRIVSAAFVDSSEDTSDGEDVKERERQQRKGKRVRASPGQKSPPVKRRKPSNSEAEVTVFNVCRDTVHEVLSSMCAEVVHI